MEDTDMPILLNPNNEEDDRNERIEKQLYLKEHIVNKGYSKEQFAFFVNKIKDSNWNIDVWSFDELKFIVSQFQDEYKPDHEPCKDENALEDSYFAEQHEEISNEGEPHNQDNANLNYEERIEEIHEVEVLEELYEDKEDILDHDESIYSNKNKDISSLLINKPVTPLEFEDGIRFSDKTSLSKMKDVLVDITETVYNPGGLFSFSYVEYIIETQPFGWNVARREGDFKKLRDYLIKRFPQFVIPPLLQTKSLFSQSNIESNKVFFKEFLVSLVKNPELCACKYLEEFLSIDDYEGFRGVRRMRDKEPVPRNLGDYSCLSGRAKLTIQSQNANILETYPTTFIDKYEEIMKRMKESVVNVKLRSEELAAWIKVFGRNFEELSELFIECGFDSNAGLYNDIKFLSSAYEETVIQQAESIQKHLDTAISFHMLEPNSFRELHKHKEDVFWELNKIGRELQSK